MDKNNIILAVILSLTCKVGWLVFSV